MARDLLDFAGDIADGQTPDWEAAQGDSFLGNLKKLQQLSEAFGAARAGSMAGQGAPDFKWCHLEVYEQIGLGLSNSQIANLLHLSVKTIDSYRAHIKVKLNLKTTRDLARHAMQWVLENG